VSSSRDLLQRRILPGLVVSVSRVSWPARLGAALRRRRGRHGEVELFFAFDDPCSTIALIDLCERTSGRAVQIVLRPVLRRGIPGDPAVEQKRRYAIDDARRLARRIGLELARGEPLAAEQTGFLAEWVAGASQSPALERFAVASMRRLWLEGAGPVEQAEHAAIWREQLGSVASAAGGSEAVARNERLMKRRGPYDVPAAWVHGRWYFAHDRLAQIGEWLDELGWRTA
jgi:2-hydroxychromene-2-carboxylate isomerase